MGATRAPRRGPRIRRALTAALIAAASLAAGAQAIPIPGDPASPPVPAFEGHAAQPQPIRAKAPPQHPFMAPNGNSNLHNDAYQTDTYRRRGPLGRSMSVTSTFFAHECASVTFDSRGRIVTICVGVERPFLAVMRPRTLEVIDRMDLPPRPPSTGGTFTDFSGGGYFYLDNRNRAVFPTTERHIWFVAVGADGQLTKTRDFDLSNVIPEGDGIISVLPDWRGRLWFASKKGRVGFVLRRSGRVRMLNTTEPIGNSFAVDKTGAVFIVTDKAMYRFDVVRGKPRVTWRRRYKSVGFVKPGQTQAGSGTTPTLIGRRWVAITDNADPMNVLVLKRGRRARGKRLVCRIPTFRKGASSTDQSLIGVNRSIIVENNYGYDGPFSTQGGGTTQPGIERIVIRRRGRGCYRAWRSNERAPSVVPKLSLGAGLLYTYTKPLRSDDADAWYFTAINFRTGKTVFRRHTGSGLGFNNNFAPVSIGPDGTAYVGVLGGLVALRDTR